MPRRSARLSPQAEADFTAILQWSERKFGEAAAERYRDLLLQTLLDLQVDPKRLGARSHPELPPGVLLYHLKHSRHGSSGERVKTPRHFVLYQSTEQHLAVLRILHDSRDVAETLRSSFK